MTSSPIAETPTPISRSSSPHPIIRLAGIRLIYGVLTLFVVSLIVFLATQVLPGNAAYSIVGPEASPQTLAAVERELHLDRSIFEQYTSWFGGVLRGDPGNSLVNQIPVWQFVYPRLIDSAVLICVAGIIGSVLAIGLGVFAALRRDSLFDHITSIAALVVTSLPDFVVAVGIIMFFATVFLHILPGASVLPPGVHAWNEPTLLILPVLAMVVIIIPYIFRSMRASMIAALESEYVEMARLKGLPAGRVALVHALPNAVAPTVQVVGLTFLYLAGGLVLVEYVFAYPGIGSALIGAVKSRDIPVLQFIVITLAAFYVVVNIASDVIALLVTPRRLVPT